MIRAMSFVMTLVLAMALASSSLIAQAKKIPPAASPAADPILSAPPKISDTAFDPLKYTYTPFGKRDPFEPFLGDDTVKRARLEGALTRFELSEFELRGIIWGISNPKAIVKDRDGRGHIVQRGTAIGTNQGRILRILKDEVVIAEQFRDPLGKLIVNEYRMQMKSKDERK